MKKVFLTVGTLAFLASPSLFAIDAVQTQTTLQTQQRLQNGTGMGGKKQYKHLNKYQYEYQGTNGKKQGVGTGKGQGNMSGMGQGNKGGKGMQGNGGKKGGSGIKGGKGGGGGKR